MADFNVRSDAVDVEQIMRQIRARIQEKRGVDYTEAEVQELAKVKLEKFLDPSGIRSDLLEQFRKQHPPAPPSDGAQPKLWKLRRFLDRLVLGEHFRARLEQRAQEREALHFELIHNLVLETTRLGIEIHNMKMRVESLSSRMDFDERRARSLESVVQYKPAPVERPADRPSRDDRGQRQQRPSRQFTPTPPPAPMPSAQPAPIASQPSVDKAALPASAEVVSAPPSGDRAQPSPGADRGPGQTGDRTGPDGERRRRRRRRRRRPGQNMADRTGTPGTPGSPTGSANTNGAPPSHDHHDDGGDDGQDEHDGPDGEADGQ